MVFYFLSNVVDPPMKIYMGLDKYENEELLRWGWPEDVWFHVDKMSSAHVYLRLPKGETIESIPAAVLTDCAQLVKANSIQGNKANNISVVYTPFCNLKKTANMDVGQVGFHKQREVKVIAVEKRLNEIVNRLNKTKQESQPDLRAEREERDAEERQDAKKKMKEQRDQEKEEERRRKEEEEKRSYSNLMREENMTSNQNVMDDEDDFI
ncbi:PREDICTED: coiled-coil domain-containing protein 25-like [Branchiostoma belcheri]|uniref:Coiled-coil domain-containing protein 25 n=1 Tax=Branchiostoma belcheri TaxID=7741 RepID=A0A6P4ZUU8_BRABE|nr:PREDICTED: coiled-coil domain-containing protein 25-like [Branchiostoma belcheri]